MLEDKQLLLCLVYSLLGQLKLSMSLSLIEKDRWVEGAQLALEDGRDVLY